MKIWEYQIDDNKNISFEEWLMLKGRNGWELVHLSKIRHSSTFWGVFKREKIT